MTIFFNRYIDEGATLPDISLASSVFLIAREGSKILAVKNDRGWEVPGGHIEEGEDCQQALIREIEEEAGATFSNEKLFAFIESDDQDKYKDKVMLIYVTDNFKLGELTLSDDVLDREVIEISEFLERYKGRVDFRDILSRLK